MLCSKTIYFLFTSDVIVWSEDYVMAWYNMWIRFVCDGFPWWECVGWNYFFWAGGFHILNRVLSKFQQSLTCLYFKLWVVIIFLNELGYHMPCEFLDGVWKTGTHSRTRGGCHMSTSPGRGVTLIIIKIKIWKELIIKKIFLFFVFQLFFVDVIFFIFDFK